MRRSFFCLLLAMTGCVADGWEGYGIGWSCAEYEVSFYLDEDSDGWGTPLAEPGEPAFSVSACTAYEASSEFADLLGLSEAPSVSANALDCSDSPATDPLASIITGRIGTLCPDDLAYQQGSTTPAATAGRELVLVHDSDPLITPTTWSAAAADACGPWGWGGGTMSDDWSGARGSLLSFAEDPTATLDAVIGAAHPDWMAYAGFVGAVSDRDAQQSDLEEGWYWEDVEEGVVTYTSVRDTTSVLPFCAQSAPDASRHDRLALVFDGRWCLGLPSDAGDRYPSSYEAHFICQRDVPDPFDYFVP